MTVASRWLLLPLVLLGSLAAAQAQEASPAPSAATPPPAGAAGAPTAKYVWSQCRVNGPYIAMTFDDGPSATLTPKLLDILKERHMHVTFFLVGENAKAHPEIIKREFAEGHEIGDHSWSHPNLAKMSDEAVRSELDRTKDAIVAAIGQAPTLMRPPYGSLTAARRSGCTTNWASKLSSGTWTRTMGSGPDRPSSRSAFLKARTTGRSSSRTTSIRVPSRRCPHV